MDSWAGARLSRDNSLAISADIHRKDVISVEVLIGVVMLSCHLGLLATVEGLLSSGCIHDDAHCRNHVDCFAVGRVPQVLLAVSGSVTIDMLNCVFSFGSLTVCLCTRIYIYWLAFKLNEWNMYLLTSSGAAVLSKSKLHQPGAFPFLALNKQSNGLWLKTGAHGKGFESKDADKRVFIDLSISLQPASIGPTNDDGLFDS